MNSVACPTDKITKYSAQGQALNGFIPVFQAGTTQGDTQIAIVNDLSTQAKAECEKRCKELADKTPKHSFYCQ